MRDRFPTLTFTIPLAGAALLAAPAPAVADLSFGGPFKVPSNPVAHTVQEGLGSDPKPEQGGGLGDLAEPRDYGDTDWSGVTFDPPLPEIRFGDLQVLQGASTPGSPVPGSTAPGFDPGHVAGGTELHQGGGASAIPAPGAIALLGLAALLGHRRRRHD